MIMTSVVVTYFGEKKQTKNTKKFFHKNVDSMIKLWKK